MDLLQVAPELAARLANYTLDDRARIVLRDIAPLVDAQLDAALDQAIAGAANLPKVAAVYAKHSGDIKRIEVTQFRAMLRAEFGAHYLECCRKTVEEETALGFEGRARINAGAAVFRIAIAALAKKHRFSSTVLAERARVCRRRSSSTLPTPRPSSCSAWSRPHRCDARRSTRRSASSTVRSAA
jgi:hypothetical protein